MEEFLKRVPGWLFGAAAFAFVTMLAYSNFVSKEPFQIWGQPFGAIEKTPAPSIPVSGVKWPSGAVLLFAEAHSDDPTQPCPPDWSLFQEAAGRMPIGAGQPGDGKLSAEFRKTYGKYELLDAKTGQLKEADLRPYRLIDDEWQYYRGMEIGGAEVVTLAEAQMPRHNHPISTSRGSDIHDGLGGSSASHGIDEEFSSVVDLRFSPMPNALGKTGASQPHPNMPPYIALYFCKKD